MVSTVETKAKSPVVTRWVSKAYSFTANNHATITIPIPAVAGYSAVTTGSYNLGGLTLVLCNVSISGSNVSAVVYNYSNGSASTTFSIEVVYARSA